LKINPPHSGRAFSLLEVMIASAIFIMVLISILALVTQGLQMARSLRSSGPTPGMVAAEVINTNRMEEGTISGDFGDIYPEHTWICDIYEASSNGLMRADILVTRELRGKETAPQTLSILIFNPNVTVRR
jgi:hypothetical protein